jgi:hypothetical protein
LTLPDTNCQRVAIKLSVRSCQVSAPSSYFNLATASLKLQLGRKAWLFCGSDDHAKSTAALYSLVASARLHGFHPEKYLRSLIRLVPLWPADRIIRIAASEHCACVRPSMPSTTSSNKPHCKSSQRSNSLQSSAESRHCA